MAELSEDEGKQLALIFNQLKIKPKFDTKEDLENWLKSYATTVKTEPTTATTTTSTTYTQQPRISLFYGDKVKGEASYDQWVYEVKCLLLEKTHKPEALAQAIRRSLRGEASNLARRLGIGATIPEILDKFQSVYGDVDTKENLLARFYSASQKEDEDVTKWSCRLEDILATAVERKLVNPSMVNEMLHNMFWQGLKPSLKDISGYKFEQIKDFDKLRVEIRKIEQDHLHHDSKPKENKATGSVVSDEKSDNSEIKEMKTMLQSLTNTVKDLEKQVNKPQDVPHNLQQQKSNFNYKPKGGGGQGNYNPVDYRKQQYPNPQNSFSNTTNSKYNNFNQSFNSNRSNNYQRTKPNNTNQASGRFQNQNNDQSYQNQESYSAEGDNFNQGPLCFRCGLYGHYQ